MFKNALNGKCKSKGGMNVLELYNLAKSRGYAGNKNRKDIILFLNSETFPKEDDNDVLPLSCKITKTQKLIDSIFKPDLEGISQWVSREKLIQSDLNWGNNGNGRHGIYFGDNRYNWEKQGTRKITRLKTNGFNTNFLRGAKRPIRKDIDKHHKKTGCIVCGSKSSLVTDHKNDLYNDPRVLNRRTQTIDDFQCLCNHCNLQKRQICKITLRYGKRIGATSIPSLSVFGLDFIEGDESFDKNDICAMKGTYWYDPIEFMKKIKTNIK